MKLALRIVSSIGLILFGAAFAATFLSPIHFEQAGKDFISNRIEAEVRAKIQQFQPASSGKFAGILSQQFRGEATALRRKLEEALPEKVSAVVAQMLDLNCECRDKLAHTIRQSFELRITSLQDAQSRLFDLIEGKYVETVQKLLRELRIFSGSNAVAFLCLLIASNWTDRRNAQLSLPAGLLLISTLASVYFYLFAQNWFLTIIFNDYVGYGYAAYLALVFLLLCDVVLNGAKVTTELINSVLNLFGSALSAC